MMQVDVSKKIVFDVLPAGKTVETPEQVWNMFKVNNKIPERRQWPIANVSLLLTLNTFHTLF